MNNFLPWRKKSNNQYFDALLPLIVPSSLTTVLLAVIVTVFFRLSDDNASWTFVGHQLGLLLLEFTPILLAKWQVDRIGRSLVSRSLWWFTAVIFLPVLLLLLANNWSFYQSIFVTDVDQFALFVGFETLLLIQALLSKKKIASFNFKPSLDNSLFLLVIAASSMMALMVNSHEGGFHNQPIPVRVDVKKNLVEFSGLVSYFAQFFVVYFCIYLVYWVNHHVLVNRVLTRFGPLYYLAYAVAFIIVAVPTLAQVVLLLPMNISNFTVLPGQNYNPFDVWNYRFGFIILFISLPLILAFKWQEHSKQMAELKEQSVQSELRWLQQQINPHFLFNTLNNLYSLVLKQSPKAPELLLTLANLLRFVVYEGSKESVSLAQDVRYLKDYLALQQVRVSNKCTIEANFPDEQALQGHPIIPLLLINFVENAFKHGIEPSDQHGTVSIELTLDDKQCHFSCVNSLPTKLPSSPDGVGLENVKRRLALSYPGAHTLRYGEKDGQYTVSLSLDLAAQ